MSTSRRFAVICRQNSLIVKSFVLQCGQEVVGMGKKAIIFTVSIVAVIIGIAVLVFVPQDAVIVTNTSSFIFSSDHFYVSNPVLKIKLPYYKMNSDDLDVIEEERKAALETALETVCEADSGAFRDEFTSVENMVFEVEGYIYYYRTTDAKNVYKFNKTTGEITAVPLSGYNGFSSPDLRDRYEEIDHNYAAFVDIKTEGLIDAYPGLKNALENLNGNFYYNYSYYDNGRMFFDVNNTVYEYLPESDSVRKIASVDRGETVIAVLDMD